MTKQTLDAESIAAIAQAIAQALAPTLAATQPVANGGKAAGKTTRKGKRASGVAAGGKPKGTFGAADNYAPTGALTRENYVLTLNAAREAGHPWADRSDKPVVHILKRAGTLPKGQPARDEAIRAAKAKIFA